LIKICFNKNPRVANFFLLDKRLKDLEYRINELEIIMEIKGDG